MTWPTLRQSGIPCLLNSGMAGTQNRFSSDNLIGPNTVAFNVDVVTVIQRGDLLVVTSGPYSGARMRVVGLNRVDGVGSIDDFLYAQCEQVY